MPAFLVGGKVVAGYAWTKRRCSYYPHSSDVLVEVKPWHLDTGG